VIALAQMTSTRRLSIDHVFTGRSVSFLERRPRRKWHVKRKASSSQRLSPLTTLALRNLKVSGQSVEPQRKTKSKQNHSRQAYALKIDFFQRNHVDT
jgi:hypothetical protein